MAPLAPCRLTLCRLTLAHAWETAYKFVMSFLLLLVALALCAFGFWLWMLIDCATNEPTEGNNRVVWVIIIACAHVIGALLYLLVRRDKRIAETGH